MDDENKHILENKNGAAVICYLGFLQNNISRMGSNSSNTKAFVSVVMTIFVTVITTMKICSRYWWIGLLIAIAGIILDSYYLAYEKMYRTKYNNFCKKLNDNKLDVKEIYDMNPKNTYLKYEIVAEMCGAFKSFSVWGFHFLCIAISLLLKFI